MIRRPIPDAVISFISRLTEECHHAGGTTACCSVGSLFAVDVRMRPIADAQQHQCRGHRLFFARGIPSLKHEF